MSTTRKYFSLTMLISGLLLTQAAQANNQGSQFSLSLDALGQGIFIQNSSAVSFGGGGQAFLDWRPLQFISFGVGAQLAYYPGSFPVTLTSLDLGGRIFPGNTTSLGEFYLQGGVGLNLLSNPGHYHGYAGLGWRQFLSPGLALDMGAQYDFFSPIAQPLNGASAKLGLSFLFGRDDWSSPVPAHRPLPKTFVVGAAWNGPSTYKLQEGDDLRTMAARIYGDEGLYPLLLDANKEQLARVGFRPGLVLKVPQPPKTKDDVERIEKLAMRDSGYLKWQKKSEGLSGQAYAPAVTSYRWRYGDDLPSVAEKLYGDGDLYPLLVDANEERLIHPANLVPGKVLKVPALPSADALSQIRFKADGDSHYIWWRNVSLRHLQDLNKSN